MQQFTLEGKTILITGASSGIGRGIAIACAEAGAKCILAARNMERLSAVKEECGGFSGHIIEQVDMASSEQIVDLVGRLPQLDGVVSCAGVNDGMTPLKFLSPEFIDNIFAVNVRSQIFLLSQLSKKNKLNRMASVILMSSVSSFKGTAAHSVYAASKGALAAFARCAALELAGKKIRVNTIAPGMINTPLVDFSNISEEQRKINESRYPLKRYGETSDVAGAALYLLSDVSQWVTGSQLVVDGGLTIGG